MTNCRPALHCVYSHVNLLHLLFLLEAKGQKFIIAPLSLNAVTADSFAHLLLPHWYLFTPVPAVNSFRISWQTRTIFIPLLCCFCLSYSTSCTCIQSSFFLSRHVCQAITTSISPPHWFSSLPFPLAPAFILTYSGYTSLSQGFPSYHLSMSLWSRHTITICVVLLSTRISSCHFLQSLVLSPIHQMGPTHILCEVSTDISRLQSAWLS